MGTESIDLRPPLH